jgi:phosphoribosyl-ATP pyrophosphohydrolase
LSSRTAQPATPATKVASIAVCGKKRALHDIGLSPSLSWVWEREGAGGRVRAMSTILQDLFSVIQDRKVNPKEGSYTCHLFAAGENEILKKMGEEVVETIVAVKGESDERLVYEVADLLYHTLVLLAYRDIELADVEDELTRRFKPG